MARVGIIDNYDSFTYNLVQLVGGIHGPDHGPDSIFVWRNDAISLEAIERQMLTHLIISPGPGTTEETGISIPAIRRFAGRLPILGVCMGQQCMAAAWGGRVVRAPRLMHGKTSAVYHHHQGLFADMPNPFTAARYHSLIVERSTLPSEFEITAWTADGEIMALRHRDGGLEGVQFHPESFMTECGQQLMRNYLNHIPTETGVH